MKTIKVYVVDLLKHLKENREKHIKDYDEAMIAYRKAIQEELKSKQVVAAQNLDVSHSLKTVRPQSFLESYDEAIAKLEWTTDTQVELDTHDFNQYVQDNWQWKNTFATTTLSYKA